MLLPLGGLLALAAGCGASRDQAAYAASLEARRLAGIWTATLRIDGRSALGRRTADSLSGSMALLVARHGEPDGGDLRGITHAGVYDLDFATFGWPTQASATLEPLVARIVPARLAGHRMDSVYVVLSPDHPELTVRLLGVMHADSITGDWRADVARAGGGTGTFVLRRGPAH